MPPSADWGVYVHVPWCRRRCPYCAFYVEVDRDVPWDAFVDAVLRERDLRASSFAGLGPAKTLYLGGGTPSRMPAGPLARLVGGVELAGDAEISAEANPEDVDEGWLDVAVAAGINRVSLGMQTLDPRFAHLLNRACTVDRAEDVARRTSSAGLRTWSIDVIFGLPGQSVGDLRADLDRLLACDPPHVSLYGLTIEPGTPFERARDRGSLVPADEDRWREMYDLLVAELAAHGLRRYEVSNFAKPGHESVHNRLYWTDRPYLGLGPSAHGYLPDGTRYVDVRDVGRYLAVPDPTDTVDAPDPERVAIDLVVSAMRSVDGLDRAHLRARTGMHVDGKVVRGLVSGGVIREDGERIALTDGGFPVADGVVDRLVRALGRPAR